MSYRARNRRSKSVSRKSVMDALEQRQLLTAVVGLTAANELVSFDSDTPTVVSSPLAITGLANGESIVGIDFRPANTKLYALGSTGQLYTVNTTTGAATTVGTALTLTGTSFGVDFNPQVDRLRVVTDANKNYRINPGTGALVATDTDLAYANADVAFGTTPAVADVAYSNNISSASLTTLYGIDSGTDTLVIQGSVGGTPTSPNTGTLTTVGALGVDVTSVAGFDIAGSANTAYAVFNTAGASATPSTFYTINLTTGAATAVGVTGAVTLMDIAVVPANPTFYALGANRTSFVTFTLASLGTTSTPTAVTGLPTNETLVGIDFRPATGTLFGVGAAGVLYSIDTTSGAATAVNATAFSPALTGTNFGVDFNPVADRVRIVSNTGQNARINPTTGAIVDFDANTAGTQTDTNLDYIDTDTNAAATPDVQAVAYTSNASSSTSTTLYGIDATLNTLVIQGSISGSIDIISPNSGQLTTIGALGIDVVQAGFDIGLDQTAYLLANEANRTDTRLYSVNLRTGTALLLGTVGDGTSTFTDLAAGLSVINLSAATQTVSEGAGTATYTLTRSGLTTGTATVAVNFTGGTATSGVDFGDANTATTPTLVTFADGETTKTFTIGINQDALAEDPETFSAVLSLGASKLGTAQFGSATTNVTTIADDDTVPTISVNDVTSLEGDSGTTTVTFTVTLSAPSGQTITVKAGTDAGSSANGTFFPATAGADYTAVAPTVITFAPGETSKTFSVTVTGDSTFEQDETFFVALTEPTLATISKSFGAGVITNDDAGARLQADPILTTKNNIYISGSSNDDDILVRKSTAKATKGLFEVLINGVSVGTFDKKAYRILGFGGAGDDTIRLDKSLSNPAELHGGAGNDLLIGSKGKDFLFGGAGTDDLHGRAGEDVLIAGSSTLESNAVAMGTLVNSWLGKGKLSARAGILNAGVNGFAFSSTTITNDTETDFLAGEGSTDLFYISSKDKITDDTLKGNTVNI